MTDNSNFTDCPVCLATPASKFEYLADYEVDGTMLKLYRCQECGVKFWQPFKNPGPEWYKKCEQNLRHRSFEDKEYFVWLSENRGITKHFFDSPPHANTSGIKLLDVGCGTGGFLLQAKKLGYEVEGVDFDEEQIKVARSFGLEKTYQGDVVDFLQKHQGEYDVITGFEIIEHVDAPRAFLGAIYKALKPGGILCLSTPNNRRIGPRNEFWDMPYHHLTRWTKNSLSKIVGLEKFKSIKVEEELPTSYLISKSRFGLGAFIRRRKAGAKKEEIAVPAKQYKDSVARLGSIKDHIIGIAILPVAWVLYWVGKKGQGLYLTARK